MVRSMGYFSLMVVVDGDGTKVSWWQDPARASQESPQARTAQDDPEEPAEANNAPGVSWGPVERSPARGRMPGRHLRRNGRENSEDEEGKKGSVGRPFVSG